jgi:peptide/nickel transport system substrate-binding protein
MTFAEASLERCRFELEGLSMKRRDFLKSTAAVAGAVTAPAIFSSAKAQSRQETLLIVSESGPNNIDIHGVGTNVPGYEVSWNCYDRLISHEMKTGANGVPYYDRDKFKMELAEDMNVGPMSATFKLKKNAAFQDGTPVTAKDVKWSLDRAVTVGGFPTFQMGAGSLTKPEQFVVVDDNTFRVDFASRKTPRKKTRGAWNTPNRTRQAAAPIVS